MRLRQEITEAAVQLGTPIDVVLRGDSTLRGHVFTETSVFETESSVLLFVPAFPDGGRTTTNGTHMVDVGDGQRVPAGATEYAADPVFPFRSSNLVEYVSEKSGRKAIGIPRASLTAERVADALVRAPLDWVVVPDAETNGDIRTIADGVRLAQAQGVDVVVRTAAPLAAELAGVASSGFMQRPIARDSRPVLVVCGSHTTGATAQLKALGAAGVSPVVIDTDGALANPDAEGRRVAREVEQRLHECSIVALATERFRRGDHNTLAHGEKVMSALTTAVEALLPSVRLVVAKGGITSADVARRGIGATSALVLGQISPGISAWQLRDREGRDLIYVIVPGNIGDPNAIVDSIEAALGAESLLASPTTAEKVNK